MRLLLLLLLVNGLVPGAGEIVEAVVHYVAQGHLAHSDADHGDLCDQGQEHGCGTTEHLCSCCASLSFVAPTAAVPSTVPPAPSRPHLAGERVASLDAPAPPFRPPIAS